jgi:hypothetical protein
VEPPQASSYTPIDPDSKLFEQIGREVGEAVIRSSVEGLLQQSVSLSYQNESLSKVLAEITCHFGAPIVIDNDALKEGGIVLDSIRVYFHGERVPLRLALEVLLKPYGLQAEVKGCVVSVTTQTANKGSEEASEDGDSPRMCGGSACPKCERLHAERVKKLAVDAQVSGLLKACYLAIGEGRFEKAADLAREAYALDPARVEGDPLIYKMHLLAEQGIKKSEGKSSCPHKCKPEDCPPSQRPANADKNGKTPACDDPNLSLRPSLPEASCDVPALDGVLTGKDELGKKDEQPR